MDVIISPSLLSANFGCLEQELWQLEEAGLDWVHWDVMDGLFVPNITFGPPVIKQLRKKSKLFFDVHLMIEKPERYFEVFVEAGADLICFHVESCLHLERAISSVKDLGVKVGLALNPATPLSVLDYVLPELDMVLVMSVNPGFGGQKFIPFSLQKIRDLKAKIDGLDLKVPIQVDGGVSPQNISSLVQAGASIFVSGSAFFKFPPYAQRLKTFLEAANNE